MQGNPTPYNWDELPPNCSGVSMAPASDLVVVDHADGLHKGVADGGADEFEAAFLEVFAHGVALRRGGGRFAVVLPAVDDGPPPDKAPDIGIKAPELGLDFEEGSGVSRTPKTLRRLRTMPGSSKAASSASSVSWAHTSGWKSWKTRR